jgi:hypothetical protein
MVYSQDSSISRHDLRNPAGLSSEQEVFEVIATGRAKAGWDTSAGDGYRHR